MIDIEKEFKIMVESIDEMCFEMKVFMILLFLIMITAFIGANF